MDYQKLAKNVINHAASALSMLADNLPKDFVAVADRILKLKGRVILIGMGKSGYIARKISSSLSSTGTPSFFVHPGEASHGDLGMITKKDIVIMLSNSGETKELSDAITYCRKANIPIVGMTMKSTSTLAKNCNYLLLIPEFKEASSVSAPTTSAMVMLALGDALAICLHEAKGFSSDDFKKFHPGGKLGEDLLKIQDLMHKEGAAPIVKMQDPLSQVILTMSDKNLGCAMVVNDEKEIVGIIAAKNLRKHINHSLKKKAASEVMTKSSLTINQDQLATEALSLMNEKTLKVLPVTGKNNKITGVLHINDLKRNKIGK